MSKHILKIHLQYRHPSDLAAVVGVASMVCVVLLGLVLSGHSSAAQPADQPPPAFPSSQALNTPLRQYYLTSGSGSNAFSGANADGTDGEGDGVCSLGYHFASLFEILDPSNLRYNVNHGATNSDSGMGPPSDISGWVRTGYNNNASTTPGMANCNGWDQVTGDGTTFRLPSDWSDASQQDIHVWNAETSSCSGSLPVWCVADEPDTSGACSQPERISCNQVINADTTGMPSHIDQYSCNTWNESGPDTIYALSIPVGDTDITVTIDDGAGDVLDVFFLGSGECYSGLCETAGDDSFQIASLDAETYYIAVDGPNHQQGPYTLEVNCSKSFLFLPLVVK